MAAVSTHAISASASVESGRIRGRVIEAWGEPIAELTVWLLRADVDTQRRYLASIERPQRAAITNLRGEFEFAELAPGAWLVGPAPTSAFQSTPDDHGIPPLATLVELRGEHGTQDIEIRTERGLMIRGRVLQPDGTPAFSGVVIARSQDAPGHCFAATRSDGAFTLGPLVSGQYELWADGDAEGTTSAVVFAFAGDDSAVLRLREGGTLSGRVVDGRGSGTGRATLLAMRQDIEPHEMRSTSAESDGRFHFENLAPGVYQVLALTEDAWFAARSGVDVDSSRATEDLVLELTQGGRLTLTYPGDNAVRFEIRQEDVRIFSSTIAELDAAIGVPAGRITVRWSVGSGPNREQRVEIVPGAATEIVISD
jgi:hypothetical protein